MTYVRKTTDEWQVQGNYSNCWECVTVEETAKAARAMCRDYDRNEPFYPHRVKCVRVKK